jgi:parvulin-like peptidyl-prolyl isomerase
MNRTWVVFLFLAVFFVQCKRSSGTGDVQPPVDPAAAVENKVILTIADASLTNRDLKNFIKLQYSDIFDKKDNDKLLSRLFDVFCEQQILLFKANQQGVQVGDEEITAYLGRVRSQRQDTAVDRGIVGNVLKVQKFLLAGAYRDIDVSDAEVAEFYETHLGDFKRSEEIELFQIMAADREKLLKNRSELLKQPSRFEEIAREESISPEASAGGAMGFFEKGMLPREMEEVVFSLQVNEISPIVESPYGFHLFKVSKKRKARMQRLADVRDEIKSKLLSAKLTAAYGEFLAGLRSEVPFQVHYDQLYFSYIKSDPGVNDNENENLSGGDPLPGG